MEKVKNIKSPFMCYCAKVIPLAFDESMSYYECLCNFYNYLKNEVMPTINNNADATEELQNYYIELRDYVEHYFDNLNIQTEINNKLDDMAESGQLEEIIALYLGLNSVKVFNTVAEMKEATNLINGTFVETNGYYIYNDEGGAYYKIRTLTNEDTIDEMFLIALDDNTLVAELIIQNNEIKLNQVGAKGNGTQDDTSYLQACFEREDINKVILSNGNYRLSSQVIMRHDNTTLTATHKATITMDDNLEGEYTSFIASNGIDNIHVENLIVDGGEQTTSRYFISLINGEDIYIDNVECHHGKGYATRLTSDINVYATNMYIHDIRDENVVTGGVYSMESENVNIENIKGYNLGDHLVYIVGHDILCKDITIKNIHGANIGMDALTNGAAITIYGYTRNVLIDNCFIDNSLMGINIAYHNDWTETPQNVIVTNCIIKNSRGSGILTTGTESNKLKHLIFKGNIIDTAVDDGISIRYVDDYIISNNYINDCGRFGIQNRTASTNGNIIGNTLHNIAQAIHCIYLTRGIISNNYYNQDNDYIDSQSGITVQSSCENVVITNNNIQNCNNYNYRVRGSTYSNL